jgi:hypothetical protein
MTVGQKLLEYMLEKHGNNTTNTKRLSLSSLNKL